MNLGKNTLPKLFKVGLTQKARFSSQNIKNVQKLKNSNFNLQTSKTHSKQILQWSQNKIKLPKNTKTISDLKINSVNNWYTTNAPNLMKQFKLQNDIKKHSFVHFTPWVHQNYLSSIWTLALKKDDLFAQIIKKPVTDKPLLLESGLEKVGPNNNSNDSNSTPKVTIQRPLEFEDDWSREKEINFNLDSEFGLSPSSGVHNVKLNLKYWDPKANQGKGDYLWPPNDGGIPNTVQRVELQKDFIIDRFGGYIEQGKHKDKGKYFGNDQDSYEKRAMRPDDYFEKPYHRYIVLKPFEVERAQILPWFNYAGMGWQYKSDTPVEDLEKGGYIKKLKEKI